MNLKPIIVWLWVGLPLSWGVYQSVKKALPLFSGTVSIVQPAAK